MTYQEINSTKMGNDLTYLFVYVNEVTHNLFTPMFVFAFFLVVLISSFVFQLKFNARIRPEVSFVASSFATFGLVLLLSQVNGLISPLIFIITLVVLIASFIWLILSSGE
jgi:hypothetical protein